MGLPTIQDKSWNLHFAQFNLLTSLPAVIFTMQLDHDGSQRWKVTVRGKQTIFIWLYIWATRPTHSKMKGSPQNRMSCMTLQHVWAYSIPFR